MHLKIYGVLGEVRATINNFVRQKTIIVGCSKSRRQEKRRETYKLTDGLI